MSNFNKSLLVFVSHICKQDRSLPMAFGFWDSLAPPFFVSQPRFLLRPPPVRSSLIYEYIMRRTMIREVAPSTYFASAVRKMTPTNRNADRRSRWCRLPYAVCSCIRLRVCSPYQSNHYITFGSTWAALFIASIHILQVLRQPCVQLRSLLVESLDTCGLSTSNDLSYVLDRLPICHYGYSSIKMKTTTA